VTLKTDAAEVARSRAAVNALSTAAFERLQAFYLGDAFEFSVVICGNEDLTEDFHRPIIYLMDLDVANLVPILNDPRQNSFAVRAIRNEIRRHGVDWNAPNGHQRLFELLLFQDHRLFRGSGKSTLAHAVDLKRGTIDPNLSAVIFSAAEDRAISFSRMIRDVILSDRYRQLFPHRFPEDESKDLTEKRIRLKGRTIGSPQATFEAWGYLSRYTGSHWGRFSVDDLMIAENAADQPAETVNRFLSGMESLNEPGIRRPIERLHVGTRYREDDDHVTLRNAGAFSLVIPIEEHDGYVQDITVRGKPTHSWFPSSKIAAMQQKVLADPDEGAISWRANQLMDATAGDAKMFPDWLVKSAQFEWREIDGKRYVTRRLWNPDGSPKKDENGEQAYLPPIHPSKLDRVFGCDLATSTEGWADEWAICCLGRDREDYEYELDVMSGKGWEAFENTLEFMYDLYRPRKIAMEKAGTFDATVNLMKQKGRFQRMSSRIEMVPVTNKSKEFRILNNVAERMKMRRLLGNPEDIATQDQKRRFKPGKNATDDRLDAISVATVISRRSARTDDYDPDEAAKRQQMRMRRLTDPFTGVPLL
jgi:hypothetical protein